jgi:hypothetical protein
VQVWGGLGGSSGDAVMECAVGSMARKCAGQQPPATQLLRWPRPLVGPAASCGWLPPPPQRCCPAPLLLLSTAASRGGWHYTRRSLCVLWGTLLVRNRCALTSDGPRRAIQPPKTPRTLTSHSAARCPSCLWLPHHHAPQPRHRCHHARNLHKCMCDSRFSADTPTAHAPRARNAKKAAAPAR